MRSAIKLFFVVLFAEVIMACKVIPGNLLDDAVVTMTPTADTLYPASGLNDGPGGLPARFSTLAANPEIKVDLNSVSHGDGAGEATAGQVIAIGDTDAQTPPDVETAWTIEQTPSGNNYGMLKILDDATALTDDHGGNNLSLWLTSAGYSGALVAKHPMTKRAGWPHRITAWAMKLTADGASVAVRLYSISTGRYLTAAGVWTATPTDLLQAGTYDFGTTWFGLAGGFLDFETESEEEVGGPEVELELQLLLSAVQTTTGRFDDLAVIEAVDFMMVAGGHNISSYLAPVWESSDYGVSWTNRATFTVRKNTFFASLGAPVFARLHRLKMTGTPIEKVWLGELILGTTESMPRSPHDTISITYSEEGQARQKTPGGTEWVSNRAAAPVRRVAVRFRLANAAEAEDARALLVDELRGGAVSCVFLPETADLPDMAIFGRLEGPVVMDLQMRSGAQPDSSTEGLEYYADVPATFIEGPDSSVTD